MRREQAKTILGMLAGGVLVGMLALGWYLQRPIPDRTLAIFAVLLWATIQLDISSLVPFNVVSLHPEQNSKEDE